MLTPRSSQLDPTRTLRLVHYGPPAQVLGPCENSQEFSANSHEVNQLAPLGEQVRRIVSGIATVKCTPDELDIKAEDGTSLDVADGSTV